MVVEVSPAVLHGGEAGNAFLRESVDVCAGFRSGNQALCADCVQNACHGAKPVAYGGLARVVDARGMVCTESKSLTTSGVQLPRVPINKISCRTLL